MTIEASWERKGLDLLLAHYSMANLVHLDRHDTSGIRELDGFNYDVPMPNIPPGPWVSITLETDDDKKQFGIWKETGAVYNVDQHGACADDPFLVPEGSPYDGPVEEIDSQEKHRL